MKRLLILLFLFPGLQTAQARQTTSINSYTARLDSLNLAFGGEQKGMEAYEEALTKLRSIKARATVIQEEGAGKIGSSVIVSGILQWTDGQGGLHPIRYADIKLFDDNIFSNPEVAQVRTDGNGVYSASITDPGGLDIFLRIYTHNNLVDVLPPGVRNAQGEIDNSFQAVTETFEVTGNTIINAQVPNTTTAGHAFSIFDALIVAAQFTEGLLGAPLPVIPVDFPGTAGVSQVVGPPNLHMEVIDLDKYDWDVLHHEYGHVVARYQNIDDNPGGGHGLLQKLSDIHGKSKGTRLAWGEGWPSFFALVVQQERGVAAMNIPNAGDLRYQDADVSLDYSLEAKEGLNTLGEDDEVAVQRILWDLYDGANDKGDEVSLGFGPIWSAMLQASPKNLSGFWNALTQGKTMKTKSEYGGIFAEWGVAPMPTDPLDGHTVSLDGGGRVARPNDGGALTLTWDENGGAGDNFKNDKFIVEFYDPDLTFMIHTSPELTAPQYTPTEDDWYKINFATFTPEGSDIRWIVKGWNTNAPETGLYISPAYLIDGGVDVGFVLDTHGNMSGKLDGIQRHLIQALENYPDDRKTLFQLTTFEGDLHDGYPYNERLSTPVNGAFAGQVAALSPSGSNECEDQVASGYVALTTRYLEMDAGGRIFFATNRYVSARFAGNIYRYALSLLQAKGLTVDVLLMGTRCPRKTAATAKAEDEEQDALQAYAYMARETGGTFVYLPESESGDPREVERLENTVYNMTRATLGAAITFVETPTAPPDAGLTVTLQAGKTHFDTGTTLDFGSGITVSDIEAVSPTKLKARLAIAPGTTLGFREVTATTPLADGSVETATGAGVFEVADAPAEPVLLSVFPGESAVGETLTVTIDGFNTGFDATSSLDMGEGISVLSVNPVSSTQLEATVLVEETAATGFHEISVQTGTSVATAQRAGTFLVLEASSSAALASIIPETAAAGAVVSVAINGQGTSFQAGVSTVSFSGNGITVLTTTVATPDLLVANLVVDAGAQNGLRDVVVTTGGEVAFLTGGFEITGGASGVEVEAQDGLPTDYRLAQNYPNPFNPTTVISFDVKQTGPVRLTVYDALGREVARLVDRMMTQGAYTVGFDAGALPSGVYFYQLRAGDAILNRKMIVAK